MRYLTLYDTFLGYLTLFCGSIVLVLTLHDTSLWCSLAYFGNVVQMDWVDDVQTLHTYCF